MLQVLNKNGEKLRKSRNYKQALEYIENGMSKKLVVLLFKIPQSTIVNKFLDLHDRHLKPIRNWRKSPKLLFLKGPTNFARSSTIRGVLLDKPKYSK